MKMQKISEDFPGRIIRFRDGDTVNIEMAIGWDVIICRGMRLVGIESWEPSGDTLERAQAAAAQLTAKFSQRQCIIRPLSRGLDCYGRIRGTILIDDSNLAGIIVGLGLAWYGKPGALQPAKSGQ
jgi:endonuclease YncB( thermonuclease family)